MTDRTLGLIARPTNPDDLPSAAKGWVVFTISGSLNGSYNVTDVDDDGTGNFGVNWATDFSGTGYSYSVSVNSTNPRMSHANGVAVGALELIITDKDGVAADPDGAGNTTVIAFGDQ